MKKSFLFILMLFATVTTYAQITTSSMTGFVTLSDGSVASGASVKATHIPSGTVYSIPTNESGRFNIANMRVGGPYKVEVTHISAHPGIYEDIYLQLGQSYVLNSVLLDSSLVLEEVVISASSSKLNNERTGASTNVGLKKIQELPQVSRSITEFTRLTPQASGNSFAGRDARYNNLQIDGANFNNGFGLSSNPTPGGNFQPISLDAIEEIQVNIAPFDVTQSGFTGAGINAVTKSGTNTFHGSLYDYFNNEHLNGVKIKDTRIDFIEGAKRNNGITFGGPIIKDKLFFFINAEREESTGAMASGANLWRSSKDGVADASNNITRVKTSDLIAVQNHLKKQWNYDPGRYEGYADEARQYGNKILARLDWNINDDHKLALRYNLLSGSSMQLANGNSGPRPRSNSNRVSQNSMVFENGNYSMDNYVSSITGELNSTFGHNLSNKFLATYTRIEDTRGTPSKQEFPFVDIWDANVGNGDLNYISFGTELFSYNNAVINDNFSFVDNLTYTLDNHTFTGGAGFEVQKFGNSYIRQGTSYYRYASVADFLTTGTPGEVAPIMFGLTYPYEGKETFARINFGMASLYVQDKYAVNDRLDLTLGLRAELPIYMNELTPNPSIDELTLLSPDGSEKNYSSGTWPKSRVQLSPRFGFNYDVMGDRSLILRGGTGFFSGRVPFVWLTNMPTGAGVLQNTIEPGKYEDVKGWIGNVKFNPDKYYHLNNIPAGAEDVFIKNPKSGAPSSFSLIDDDFKMPMVWRSSIGADYKIPESPITLTADILYTKDINAAYQYGANRKQATKKMNYSGDDRDYYPDNTHLQYNDKIGANSAVVLTNTENKGYAFNATIGATVSDWNGLSGSLFYTYSEAKEVSANAGSNANSAWGGSPTINSPNDNFLNISNFAVPHRVVAGLNYKIANTTIGLYYNGSHQGRFSYYYQNDINGDGHGYDLIYLPMKTSELNFDDIKNKSNEVLFTAEQQSKAFDSFIKENDLESYRGGYLPRNGFLLPWLNRIDVRITQDLFKDIVTESDKLQFTLDIVNFANMLNSNWGIQTNLLSSGTNVLRQSGWKDKANGVPSFQMLTENNELVKTPFRKASTTGTTWSAMIGLRYNF